MNHINPEHDDAAAGDLESRLDALIRRGGIPVAFQPIVDLESATIHGYEALARPDGSFGISNPAELFAAAERFDRVCDVEARLRASAFSEAAAWLDAAHLFVNNSPVALLDPGYPDRILEEATTVAGLDPHRIVLEITEKAGQSFTPDVGVQTSLVREHGFHLAIDDVGAGISGLNQIMSLRPNWIKLDLELIRDIDHDPLKQHLIRFLVRFARLSDMRVVAEGIEREGELATLIELGVSHAQGFLLARPGCSGAGLNDGVREMILRLRDTAHDRQYLDACTTRVEAIASPVLVCDRSETIEDVVGRLERSTLRSGVVVLDRRRFVGWIDRPALDAAVAAAAGSAPVGGCGLVDSPVVGADVTLAEALDLVASRPESKQTAPLVVQSDGAVVGLVRLTQLLGAAADVGRRAPSRVAALTGLPSRVQADQWLRGRIAAGDAANVVFIDLRDFDAYNLTYGLEMGDAMLLRLVELMQRHVVDELSRAFLAHLGEDRFLLWTPDDPRPALGTLVERFETIHGEFFSSVDFAARVFSHVVGSGQRRLVPLTTLRIVVLPAACRDVSEPRELYASARALRMRTDTGDAGPFIVDERRASREMRRGA